MTTHSLASFISQLTHRVDGLERTYASLLTFPVYMADQLYGLLVEIAALHALIDDMNAAYVELEDKEQDAAFEAVGC